MRLGGAPWSLRTQCFAEARHAEQEPHTCTAGAPHRLATVRDVWIARITWSAHKGLNKNPGCREPCKGPAVGFEGLQGSLKKVQFAFKSQ